MLSFQVMYPFVHAASYPAELTHKTATFGGSKLPRLSLVPIHTDTLTQSTVGVEDTERKPELLDTTKGLCN